MNEILIIKDYTGGAKINDILLKYKIGHAKLRLILRRNNIPERNKSINRRQYLLDESFFEKIDTQGKAYWLGFLYADGWICNKNHSVGLTLKASDGDHLIKFKKYVKSNAPITTIKSKQRKIKNQIIKSCLQKNIMLHSKKVKMDLISVGCGLNKSLTLEFPNSSQVPQDLLSHFIRGYFDGDGCLSSYISKKDKNPRKAYQMTIVGSDQFILSLKDFLLKILNVKIYTHKRGKVSILSLKTNERCKIFCEWIYSNSQIHLKRKYKIYQKMLKTAIFNHEGENSPYAKDYVFKKDNTKIKIKNLTLFCKTNNLNFRKMWKIAKGIVKKSHNGYSLYA